MNSELVEIVKDKLKDFIPLGVERDEKGTLYLGKASHIAPRAFLNIIFHPLRLNEIDKIEKALNAKINDDLKSFFIEMNGLYLFSGSLSLFGYRYHYDRLLSIKIRQPFDIISKNLEERPSGLNSGDLIIGFYDWDGSLVLIEKDSGKIYRVFEGVNAKLNEWENLFEFLQSEIERLSSLFDPKTGKPLDEEKPTIPPASPSGNEE